MQYYIVKAKPVAKVHWNNLYKTLDENLGEFIVTPIKKFNKVIGFKEVLTGETIVNRFNYLNDFDNYDFIDYFSHYSSLNRKVGDVAVSIEEIKDEEQVLTYLQQTPEQIKEKIAGLEINAIRAYQNSIGLTFENKPLDYYKKELYALTLKDQTRLLVYPKKRLGTTKSFYEIITGHKVLKYLTSDFDANDFYLGSKFSDCMSDKYFSFDETAPATRILPSKSIDQYMNSSNPITISRIEESLETFRNEIKQAYQKAKK